MTKSTVFAATVLLFTTIVHAQPPQRSAGEAEKWGQRMARSPLFAALDSDRDGQLSAEEIASAAKSLAALDRDGDGAVTTQEIMETRRQQMSERFQALDQDGDGALSQDEIPERMQGILSRFDEDSDGSLSAEELQAMKQRMQDRLRRGPAGEDAGGARSPRRARRAGRGQGPPARNPAPDQDPVEGPDA
jgi:Ca2+-binding EF-hand superfamily protein